MGYPFVTGKRSAPPEHPIDVPVPDLDAQNDPKDYLLDGELVDAINVALLLGQPLLLTGDPGTGKTQLAHRLAWELGYGKPHVFNTKSTSTARDLFYTFDTMGRFRDAYAREARLPGANEQRDERDALRYLTYSALGVAILHSHAEGDVAALLPEGYKHPGPRRSVVLIDEIDKAPRDFPNDLLHEVMAMSFRIPDLRNIEVKAHPARRPVLVLTSNSERNLPDAFLRRCVFFNIPFPENRLVDIVRARIPELATGARDGDGGAARPVASGHEAARPAEVAPLARSALALFKEIRNLELRRKPSTAELINWLRVLKQNAPSVNIPVTDNAVNLLASLSTLAKTREDADLLILFARQKLGAR